MSAGIVLTLYLPNISDRSWDWCYYSLSCGKNNHYTRKGWLSSEATKWLRRQGGVIRVQLLSRRVHFFSFLLGAKERQKRVSYCSTKIWSRQSWIIRLMWLILQMQGCALRQEYPKAQRQKESRGHMEWVPHGYRSPRRGVLCVKHKI